MTGETPPPTPALAIWGSFTLARIEMRSVGESVAGPAWSERCKFDR